MSDFIKALEDEVSALEAALARDPRYIKLQEIKRLRSLYLAQQPEAGTVIADANLQQQRTRVSRPVTSGLSLEAVNAARSYLANRTTPILTRDILAHLEGMGLSFGGASPQATLASILSRAPEFESKGGRVGWVLNHQNSAGGESSTRAVPPDDDQPEAQGREAGPGGGT